MVAKKNLCVLILAAGKGTRMKSPLPKPLHPVCGLPIIAHILQAAQALNPAAIGLVVGHEAQKMEEAVKEGLPQWGVTAPLVFVEQTDLSGSGSAVKAALPLLKRFEDVMVLNGDTPLVKAQTLEQMYSAFQDNEAGAMLLAVSVPEPSGYGRVVRAGDGTFEKIVEHSDADEKTLLIHEINSGMYIFKFAHLDKALQALTPQGPKHEYYLTDTLSYIKSQKHPVLVYGSEDYEQALGVNSKFQLSQAELIMRGRVARRLMDEGVTIPNPQAVFIDAQAQIGADSFICPGCYICGKTVIGKNCMLEGNVFIKDSTIGDNVILKMGTYIEDSSVEEECQLGPYAHLRPQSVLKKGAKVGNFSEIKKSVIGEGSKVNHLSYIGDTEMGACVNVGAGTITCNYDGKNKHKTVIGDHVFIGSNVNFVAPVTVENYAKIGAGSTITKLVPQESLAIARSRQVVLEKKGIKHD